MVKIFEYFIYWNAYLILVDIIPRSHPQGHNQYIGSIQPRIPNIGQRLSVAILTDADPSYVRGLRLKTERLFNFKFQVYDKLKFQIFSNNN